MVLRPKRNFSRMRKRLMRRINRAPSPLLAGAVPWISVMLGSIAPAWLFISSAPVLPPFGFLILLAWRQLRPGLLPMWAGFPLGAFDDLCSGQPLGSAILLWSGTMILLDLIEARFPWRNFAMEWLVAAAIIAGTMLLALALANAGGAMTSIRVIVPQIAITVLVYPLTARLVAALDRFRLWPIVEVR